MTTREIQGHLKELYGVEVSPTLISAVTDAVIEDVRAWQARALEAVYPIVYLDAIHEGPIVAGIRGGQPQLCGHQAPERRCGHQPRQDGVGGDEGQNRTGDHDGPAADPVGQRPAGGQQHEIQDPHAERDEHALPFRQLKFHPSESRGVDGDEIERHRHHHGHQSCRESRLANWRRWCRAPA